MERVVLTAAHVDTSMKLEVFARVRDDVDKACLWLEYGPPELWGAQATRHALEDAIVHAKHDRFVDALACLVRARALEAADDLCMHGSPWPVPRARSVARGPYTHLVPAKAARTWTPAQQTQLLYALLDMYVDAHLDAPAQALLVRHAASWDLVRVLAHVPPTWPVRAVAPYLVEVLRASSHARYRAGVTKSVAHKVSLDAADTLWRRVRAQGGHVAPPPSSFS